MHSFLAELRRRKVVRVLVVYAAVAYAVVQAADVFVPALALPGWIVSAIALLATLGLPLALVLAWAFELTPDGVRRAEGSPALLPAGSVPRWLSGRAVLGAVLALLTGAAIGWLAGRDSGRQGSTAEAAALPALPRYQSSVAVLPFHDLSPDADGSYLGAGLAEELRTLLAQVPGLRVAARTSAFSFDSGDDVRDVAEKLGVAAVVEGSVRREGDRVRITAELIDGSSGFQLWSDGYDRELGNLIAAQKQIASAIARELRLPLGIGLQRSETARETTDGAAYDAYLRGRSLLLNRSVGRAVAAFERAVERDPTFAPAQSGLAEALALQPYYGLGTWRRSLAAAEAAARRALALDSTLASAHTALGNVFRDRRQWRAAEQAYHTALRLQPDNAEALDQYGQYLNSIDRPLDAAKALERAAELDPLSPLHRALLGQAYLIAERYEPAERALEQARSLDPSFELWANQMAALYLSQGRTDELTKLAPYDDDVREYLRIENRPAELNRRLRLLRRIMPAVAAPTCGAPPDTLDLPPRIAVAMHAPDLYFALLERSVACGPGQLVRLWYPFVVRRFGAEPRYRRLVERLDLPAERP